MVTQHYHLYTSTEHATWSVLYKRQLEGIKKHACANFITGLHRLHFSDQAIPNFETVNLYLEKHSGWSVYAVPGLIDNHFFFQQLYLKKFGATTWIRKPEQIDYLEEPDMFHDVFGHLPLLTDKAICDYLSGLARIANRYINNEEVIEAIARLYWYTIEFGLVKENDTMKIYGAGILSSISETEYCLSDKPRLEYFDVERIVQTPYIKDSFQQQYFFLHSLDELNAALPKLEKYFANHSYAQSPLS